MNRRNFFKTAVGFIAGVFATPKAKAEDELICGGQNGTLCPRCKYNGESSTGIDPNSEWAKQKYLTLDEICRQKNYLNRMERLRIEAAQKTAHPPYFIQWYYCEDKKCFTMGECSDNIHVNKDGSLSLV